MSAVNAGIVYASITGFGTADGARLPGYDLLVQALSGLMSVTGQPDDVPLRAGVAVFDVITGLHAAIGILAALHHRHRDGLDHVQVSLPSALSGTVNQTGAVTAAGIVLTRMGNAHPRHLSPLPTAEGDIVVAVGKDRQFERLAHALSEPSLATDPRLAMATMRSQHRAALRPKLLAARDAREWFVELSAAEVPCAPVLDVAEGIRPGRPARTEPRCHGRYRRGRGRRDPASGELLTHRTPLQPSRAEARGRLGPNPTLATDPT